MSSDEFERRINNQLAAIVESQARHDSEIARILEAVAGMIQVARVTMSDSSGSTSRSNPIASRSAH